MLAAIAAGGFLGTVARYEVGVAFPAAPGAVPWATFAVNTSGAFAIGLVLAAIRGRRVSPLVRPFTCVGFLGAWTTMSALAVEADLLVRDGDVAVALAYLAATVVVGTAATACGLALGRLRGAQG